MQKDKKGIQWVIKSNEADHCYLPSEELKKNAWVTDPNIYSEASKDTIAFWENLAKKGIDWFKQWTDPYKELQQGKFGWFLGGELNISYNIVDRHQAKKKDKVAIYWEPEDITKTKARVITYGELNTLVNKFANALKKLGIKKGDSVGIYLPMLPEGIISMIACARIGAVHTVVFSACSKLALNERLIDAKVKLLVTADGYYRRGKEIGSKVIADGSLNGTNVEKVVVVNRIGGKVPMQEGRDLWWDDLISSSEPYCEPEKMDSEDRLFILYTSGTTGKPKGIVHHTGGYAVNAYWTTKWNFNLHDDDVYFCTADIGWITGHTYNCYGPLLNGATIVLYDGAHDFPAYDRWWSICENYKVTVFYTSPTAIRMMKKHGTEDIIKHDLANIRLLGSVGEPINEATWIWYFTYIGGSRCPVIDTWWQTETGSILINSLPGIGPFIPGVAGKPFPGVKVEIISDQIEPAMIKEQGKLLLAPPYPPSMFRTIHNNDERYREQFRKIGGEQKYFTNDGAILYDEYGSIWLTGRIDDIMKVAGHALSTAELENALTKHPLVAEAAVVSLPDEIRLEVPLAFIVLKEGFQGNAALEASLKKKIDELIGPIARPDKIYFINDLPKTRSGKILRRMLKDLVRMNPLGDVTTLMNPDSIAQIKKVLGFPQSPRRGPNKVEPMLEPSPQKRMLIEEEKKK